MDKKRLKLIVKNLDSLVTALKSEIYPEEPIKIRESLGVMDYDEIFEDDGIQDWGLK